MLRLLISTPQGARVESFAAARIVVGRSSECELNIPEVPELSRKHLSFSVMNGVLRVEDLGSRHGTFLNEMRVSMAVVPVGSRVRAATVCITVLDVEASAIPVSASPTQEPTLTLSAELIRECVAEKAAAAPPGYTFLRVLGSGGVGVVWLAERSSGGLAAVKILHEELAQRPKARAEFVQELMLLSRVRHQGVVSFFEHGMLGARPWASMEYVAGGSLRERLEQRGKFSAGEVLGVAQQVLQVLHHAYTVHGLVHGDLKPANLLQGQECVKLCDFGLARLVSSRATDQRVSAAYCAPELFNLGVGRSSRTDLYSLGITLFHLLEGRVPFPELGTLELAKAHATEPLPWTRETLAAAPEALIRLVEHLAAKEASKRPASHEQVLADLALLLP